MTRPTIALVVPAFNASRFLPELFASVRAQSVPFDEVAVVDDASSDDTAQVAATLGATLIRHEHNAGCSGAKNTGLASVRSTWVHFHDADDLITPEFVERAKSRIRADDVDALLFQWEHRRGDTGERIATSSVDRDALIGDPVGYMIENTVNNIGCYRVETVRAVGGFPADPACLFNEDRAFHLALACAGARFDLEPIIGTITRQWSSSMSQAAAARCLLANAAVTERYLAVHPGRHENSCARALWHAATGLASHLEWRDAHRLVRRASALGVRSDPRSGTLFRGMSAVSPHLALRVREYLIRWLRPGLRAQ